MKMPLIVVDGEIPSLARINQYSQLTGEMICTDGAANSLAKLNITPDVIIGDLDSIKPDLQASLADHVKIISKPSQYATDLEKALDYVIQQNHHEVVLTGIKGKRFDHAISNISILAKYSDKIKISFFDDDGQSLIVNSKLQKNTEFNTEIKTIISLIPAPSAKGITTQGLHYPLNNEDLEFGAREGQSNFATQENIKIDFDNGCLIVFIKDFSSAYL